MPELLEVKKTIEINDCFHIFIFSN